MAQAEDKTIPQLDDGGAVRVGDALVISRAGADFRATVASAATKTASDDTKDSLASVNGAVQVGHLAVFADVAGTVEDGGEVGAVITEGTLLDLVLTTDYLPVVRGGVIYLALIDDILNAQPPSGTGGQFDFSDSINSAYAAII